jgi:hypothetical protein
MNMNLITIFAVVLVLVVVGSLLAMVFVRQNRSKNLQTQFGTEYEHTVESLGDEKKAQAELEARQKHVKTLNTHPLSEIERERYLADWVEVQAKFVDHPGAAIVSANRLIMEVMQMRGYPVSDFEQRAADLSVTYPTLVSHYRAARAIALRNELQQADTEELRQAMRHYHLLFAELVETEAVNV